LFSGSIPWAGYEQERIIFQVRKAMVIEWKIRVRVRVRFHNKISNSICFW
jgi:hypothetical protein